MTKKKTAKKKTLAKNVFLEKKGHDDLDQCSRCLPARCCSYVSMQIDDPDALEDYENLLWYVAHDNIDLYIMDGEWYMNIMQKCSALGADNRCTIYEKRPAICRSYSVKNCEFEATEEDYGYDQYFKNFDQLELYVWKKFGKRFVADAPMPKGLRPLSLKTNKRKFPVAK